METKIATGHVEQARNQLGLWIAAWHKRMSALGTSNEQIITLPLIMVVEHEWKLMFAYDQGDAIWALRYSGSGKAISGPEEEIRDPCSQGNVGNGTPSEQAPGRTKINWDEWFSVVGYPWEENEGEANEQDGASVVGMTKIHTAEDELPHAGPKDEETVPFMELARIEEKVDSLDLDGLGNLRSDQGALGGQEELYLRFKSQHKLMGYLQHYLVGVCYEFGKQTMPEVLEKHGWDCTEAAQLES
ncbi:hypothetical protein HG530_015882 [Fusarium avenaceum]|nr:hypothetical protein HG530_015882 [Fusarium avenaceum]